MCKWTYTWRERVATRWCGNEHVSKRGRLWCWQKSRRGLLGALRKTWGEIINDLIISMLMKWRVCVFVLVEIREMTSLKQPLLIMVLSCKNQNLVPGLLFMWQFMFVWKLIKISWQAQPYRFDSIWPSSHSMLHRLFLPPPP